MEDRSGLRSTVVASQLPVDKWHPSMADGHVHASGVRANHHAICFQLTR